MSEIRIREEIRSPPNKVWAVLTEPTLYPKLFPGVQAVRRTSGQRWGLSLEWEEEQDLPWHHGLARGTVTSWVDFRQFGVNYRFLDPSLESMDLSYSLKAQENGTAVQLKAVHPFFAQEENLTSSEQVLGAFLGNIKTSLKR